MEQKHQEMEYFHCKYFLVGQVPIFQGFSVRSFRVHYVFLMVAREYIMIDISMDYKTFMYMYIHVGT